jgi:hypothetical protein
LEKRPVKEKKEIDNELNNSSMILSDRQYLYKIESRKVGVGVAELADITKALGIHVRELI